MFKTAKKIHFSLIIPVYNEEKRLKFGLEHALEFLKKQRFSWEIIIVDDGSRDRTKRFIQSFLKKNPELKLIEHKKNQGKGAAIASGMVVATGTYRFFSDIDFSTPIAESEKLLRELKTHDVAIGVRRHPKSRVLVHQSKLREFLGHCFTKLTNTLATPGIYDATCGFKGFRGAVADRLYRSMRIKRWAFDAEILFLAIKWKYSIAQVPVIWANNQGTKVHILRDGVQAFLDILKIRLFSAAGLYKKG